ncbi:MAG: HRDC domain-containing protein [Desulfobacteraceae bacterium]|jgi:ribonuclease D|nr:HRDC domain-containing protein [Desulfobacteraceae bacterium]
MNATNDIGYSIIQSSSQLAQLVSQIENETAIGVDVEADSMYHFKEKVCLIQMATANINVVIDPLEIKDLSALQPIFKRSDIQKIFHGADYDVRSLYRDFRIKINNLFDTELASRFLGFPETGLEAVLKKKFAVTLDKKFQRKDWSRRPLPPEMIAYAAEDARYLLPLAQDLTTELKDRGRFSWVHEECEILSKVRPHSNGTELLYVNFKGAGKLDPRSLAILEALLQCRREIARKKDRPLFRIIGSGPLLHLAETKPTNMKQLEKTRALSPKQIGMYGRLVLEAINNALIIPQNDLPVYPRSKAPRVPAAAAERVKSLRKWRDARAENLSMDPSLILTKSLISILAVQRPSTLSELSRIKELKKWQIREFGKEILNVLGQR